MILYPAIDVLDGKVVRLVEGDFDQTTYFAETPFELFQKIKDAGINHLHLVDLNGARDPEQKQISLFRSWIQDSSLQIQLGGGIRTVEEIKTWIGLGVDRVVVGSMAVQNPQKWEEAISQFGAERLTLALDVRRVKEEVFVMIQGWQENSGIFLENLLQRYQAQGGKRVLCTDIGRDGNMAGPNFSLYQRICKDFPSLEIQASGGIRNLSDLKELVKIGIHSAIIGRAWLNGELNLQEACAYAL